MMDWQEEIIVLLLEGMGFMHVFLDSLFVYAVPILDH
jgi:hypothetical protein